MEYDIFLENLKARAVIEDIVAEYVTLKRAGSRYVGLCPFHSEKTGSFTVFTENQSYYCFGCGKGGDVINFIREKENLDYTDAVQFLADKFGMEVPRRKGSGEYRLRRDTTLKINREAARYFHHNLMADAGVSAREYLKNRKLSRATVTRFGLGYASEGWDGLLTHLTGLGYTRDQLELAGLALRGKNGGYYDRFRGRVMFPIIDTMGNVIAFGGRLMEKDAKGAKYINSPDTPAFKKSQVLFALNFAKNAPGERMILCEGYMDVISLHQAGFTSAVATLGTAVTGDHARLMARYAKEVVLALDGDAAGQTAMNKAIKQFSEVGMKVRVLSLGDAKDPDEYINLHGAQRFSRLMDGSGSHTTFLLDKELAKYDLSISEDKASYLKAAAEILCGIQSPVESEVYVNKVARQTEISPEMIRAEMQQIRRRRERAAEKKLLRDQMDKAAGVRDKHNPEKRGNLKAARAEEGLIAVLLRHPDYYGKLIPAITPGDFVTGFNRNIFQVLISRIETGSPVSVTALTEPLSVEEVSQVTQYLIQTVAGADEFRQACDYAAVILEQSRLRSQDLSQSDPEQIKQYIESKKRREQADAEHSR